MRGLEMRVRSTIASLGLIAGACAFIYRFGLTEKARASMREGAKSVSDAVNKVVETVESAAGIVVDDGPLYNREQTERDWERLGY